MWTPCVPHNQSDRVVSAQSTGPRRIVQPATPHQSLQAHCTGARESKTTAGHRRSSSVLTSGLIGPDQFRTSGDPRAGRLPISLKWWSLPPPHPRTKAHGHGGQERNGCGEARQVRLHEYSFVCGTHRFRQPGGLASSIDPRSLALRLHLAMDLPWTVTERRTTSSTLRTYDDFSPGSMRQQYRPEVSDGEVHMGTGRGPQAG